jgi:hypothetical protein
LSSQQGQKQTNSTTITTIGLPDRAVRSLAGAIYKHLQDEGCQPKDIISVSSQLLGLVSQELITDEPSV